MAQDCREGDIGTPIRVTVTDDGVAVDLSTASVKNIRLIKPDQTVLEKAASFYTEGTDGIVTYTTILNDLDQPGRWTVQVYVEMGSAKWHTSTQVFDVIANVA